MGPQFVIVRRILLQNSEQMRFIQNDDMVDALASDRCDQPLGKAILPRRGWCGRPVSDSHGAQSACDDPAIDLIPIADHVARSLIPGERFCYLVRNPLRGRVGCNADPNEVSAI